MLVAGSVLALLLMGLAVDGVLSPADEGLDDDGADNDDNFDPNDDVSGDPGTGLADLLFGGGDAVQAVEDDDVPTPEELAAQDGFHPDGSAQTAQTAADIPEDGIIDIEDMTLLADGEDVPYVEEFQPETDRLILEFDGLASEAPEIEIDFDTEDGAALILANGVPVTLVEGATDMTAEQVDIVMLDDIGEDAERLLGGADLDQIGPDQPDDDESPPQPEIPKGAIISDAPETGDAAKPGAGDGVFAGFAAPEDPMDDPTDGTLLPDLGDITDPVETLVDPVVDVVDEVTDGVPGLAELNALLDGIGTGLIEDGIGQADDMLNARGEIDAAFGTGGNDALTGTAFDDALNGTDGQDALFGDEGDDALAAQGGNDELHGNVGNDTLSGGAGMDFLNGGDGDDSLDGGADGDALFGGDGDDTLYGGGGDDVLQGGDGADLLEGGSGNDVLDGTFGQDDIDTDAADTLIGGSGEDTIMLGAGDIAMGGSGADTFIGDTDATTPDAVASVSDFDPSEDVIEILYDPSEGGNPTITVEDFSDGSGANIILNGDVVLSLTGAQGLDPNAVILRATA